jgi:hypothetical protein
LLKAARKMINDKVQERVAVEPAELAMEEIIC